MSDSASRAPSELSLTIPMEERERVVEQLSDCFAHDLIPVEELEFRVAAAYRAPTRGELAALIADLPTRTARDLAEAPTMPRRISAVLGNVEQSSTSLVPPTLEVRVMLGNVELDLTHARFAPGVTEIVVRAFLGSVEIALPPGVQVENNGSSFLGNFEHHAQTARAIAPAGDVCIVRLVGRATLGSVEIDG